MDSGIELQFALRISIPPLFSHIPAWVGKSQRVVEAVGIAVVGLGVVFLLDDDVGREHAAHGGVVHATVHVYQAEAVVVLVQGEAAVEHWDWHVVVAEAIGVAAAAPCVVAQAFHVAIGLDDGGKAALVVLHGVVHGFFSVA